jgi:hypothetical protein
MNGFSSMPSFCDHAPDVLGDVLDRVARQQAEVPRHARDRGARCPVAIDTVGAVVMRGGIRARLARLRDRPTAQRLLSATRGRIASSGAIVSEHLGGDA